MSKTLKEVKALTDRMSAGQYSVWRSNPENREDVATLDGKSSGGTTRTNLQSQPKERVAVIRSCAMCGKDAAVASDFTGDVLCSEDCQLDARRGKHKIETAFINFANETPTFYRCTYNAQVMTDRIVARSIEVTEDNLKRLFVELTREGQLLPQVSLDDLNKMSPEQYADRQRKDPELGGHREEIDGGALDARQTERKAVETARPGFEPRPREAAMQQAAEAERRAQAARYENRFAGAQQFRNGVPVPASVSSPFATFRNGRRVG